MTEHVCSQEKTIDKLAESMQEVREKLFDGWFKKVETIDSTVIEMNKKVNYLYRKAIEDKSDKPGEKRGVLKQQIATNGLLAVVLIIILRAGEIWRAVSGLLPWLNP